MDPTEHSRLLYLVDALLGAPSKSAQLLAIAIREGGSLDYLSKVDRLLAASIADRIVEEALSVKRELR